MTDGNTWDDLGAPKVAAITDDMRRAIQEVFDRHMMEGSREPYGRPVSCGTLKAGDTLWARRVDPKP